MVVFKKNSSFAPSFDRSENNKPDYSKKWYVLSAIGMGIFLSTIDGSIVNVALPTLVNQFNTRFSVVQWVVLGYILTLATLILSMGRLGDIVGRKPVYTTGMALFLVGSTLCGLAQGIYQLIFFRALQAIGASMMVALGIALITEAFPPQERGKAFGATGSFVSIGIIAGPTIGGIIIDALSWHWIFFVNIPIGIAGIYLVLKYVPNTRTEKGQRFDYWGAATFFISVLSFLLGLTLINTFGLKHPIVLQLLLVWVIFLTLFLIIESKSAHPMIDNRIFKEIHFSINLVTGFITFIGSAGIVILMPFYLENVLNYKPHEVGLLLSAVPIAAGIVSPISGMLSDRFGTRPISVLGMIVMVAGYIELTTLNQYTTSLEYLLKFVPIGIGIGIFQSPNNSAIMGAAPKERLGLVSGLLSMTRALGQSTGIAIIGAFWSSRLIHYLNIYQAKQSSGDQIPAQVKALQETISIISFIVAIALIIGISGFFIKKPKKGIINSSMV